MAAPIVQPKRKVKGNSKLLNPMQRLFVENLLADPSFNSTMAAKKAGYKAPSVAANKLMKQPVVRSMIGKALQDRINKVQIDARSVLKHLAEALFLDPLELFDQDDEGELLLKRLADMPAAVRRCITKMKTKSRKLRNGVVETTAEIEFMSKDSALTNAMKHLGLVSPDNNVNNNLIVDAGFLGDLLRKVEQERSTRIVDARFIEGQVDGDEDSD